MGICFIDKYLTVGHFILNSVPFYSSLIHGAHIASKRLLVRRKILIIKYLSFLFELLEFFLGYAWLNIDNFLVFKIIFFNAIYVTDVFLLELMPLLLFLFPFISLLIVSPNLLIFKKTQIVPKGEIYQWLSSIEFTVYFILEAVPFVPRILQVPVIIPKQNRLFSKDIPARLEP